MERIHDRGRFQDTPKDEITVEDEDTRIISNPGEESKSEDACINFVLSRKKITNFDDSINMENKNILFHSVFLCNSLFQ